MLRFDDYYTVQAEIARLQEPSAAPQKQRHELVFLDVLYTTFQGGLVFGWNPQHACFWWEILSALQGMG